MFAGGLHGILSRVLFNSLGSPSPPVEPRFGLRPLVLLGLVLLGVGLASWRPVPAGVWNDDGVYMLIGKALAHGDGLRYAGVPGDVPAVKFPPLYPLVLALLWLVGGDIGSVTLASVFLNLALVAAAGVLLALALRRVGHFGRGVPIGLAGLAFVSADVWRIGLIPLSEAQFMALTAAALACWADAARPTDRRGVVLLSVLLTTAVLTRSAGAALVVGFGLSLALVRGARVALAVAAPPVAVALGWAAWAASRATTIPEGMRDILGPYGGWLAAQSLGAPVDFLRALPAHLQQVVRLVFTLLLPGLSGPAFLILGIVVGTLAAFGLFLLRRRFPPITWVALAYVAMLVAWPFVDRRLVVPLHPLLVVAVGVALVELWGVASRRGAKVVVAGIGAIWIATYSGVNLWRSYDGWAASSYRIRTERLATAVETLRRTASPDAVVGAPEFWAALHLHGGWPAVPSALFVPRSEGGVPIWGTAEDQIALWWDAGLTDLLLEEGGRIHGDALNLVEERCPGAVVVVARMPPQLLVHIQWSDACASALGLGQRSS